MNLTRIISIKERIAISSEWKPDERDFILECINIAIDKQMPDRLHPSHETRMSDASSFDEICVHCGATDRAGGGWGRLKYPCPASEKKR